MTTLDKDTAKCDHCNYEDNLFIVAAQSSKYEGDLACGKCCQHLSLIAFPLDTLDMASNS